jgi:hypothetical protein
MTQTIEQQHTSTDAIIKQIHEKQALLAAAQEIVARWKSAQQGVAAAEQERSVDFGKAYLGRTADVTAVNKALSIAQNRPSALASAGEAALAAAQILEDEVRALRNDAALLG